MPYNQKTLNEVKGWFKYNCPCCGNYTCKTKATIIKHIHSCESNEYIGEPLDNIIIYEGILLYTAEDSLKEADAFIKTVTYFVNTNSLEIEQYKQGHQIRDIIKNKLKEYIPENLTLDMFTFQIYSIFFDMTEEDKLEENRQVNEPLFQEIQNRTFCKNA
jgi:hypothetical protein